MAQDRDLVAQDEIATLLAAVLLARNPSQPNSLTLIRKAVGTARPAIMS
jgi:hypothetical protein